MRHYITIPIRNTYSLVIFFLPFYPRQELKKFHIISQYTFKFWQNDELIENHYKEILHIWSGEVNSFNFGKYESGWENPIQSFVSWSRRWISYKDQIIFTVAFQIINLVVFYYKNITYCAVYQIYINGQKDTAYRFILNMVNKNEKICDLFWVASLRQRKCSFQATFCFLDWTLNFYFWNIIPAGDCLDHDGTPTGT